MADLMEYKCPNCGGPLKFDADAQEMKCPYCGSKINVQALAAMDNELGVKSDSFEWSKVADKQWDEGETAGMKVYICNSCGGEIVCDESTAASKCPYCDSPVVMKGNFEGDLKPDIVIPFKITKKEAKERYYKHLEGKEFLPKVFKDENHIDEMKALYVPFWMFDCDAEASATYDATRTRVWADKKNDYVKTDHYKIIREGLLCFENVPVDGSLAMPDDLMQSIEPFRMEEAVDFQTAYLSGYLADKYTVSVHDSIGAANERVRNSAIDELRNTVQGYETVRNTGVNVAIDNGSCRYAMLPVWIMNTTYDGKNYIFAINGQTGKTVGNLPLDKGAARKYMFTRTAIAAAIVAAAEYLMLFLM